MLHPFLALAMYWSAAVMPIADTPIHGKISQQYVHNRYQTIEDYGDWVVFTAHDQLIELKD